MNVLSARVVLRVRKPSDVLDLALRFVVENRIPFAKMALIVLPPGVLATWALGRSSGWAVAWAFAALFGLLAQAPFTALASRLVFEHDVLVLGVLRESARRIPFLVGVRVVHLLAVVVAASFFVVPALFVLVYVIVNVSVFRSNPETSLWGILLFATGWPLYYVIRRLIGRG